ncbi:MAG: CyaY protein [Planctomycetota bacterium]|jgi:CyaY protein
MDPHEYQLKADECLEGIATWLENFDPDEVDFATTDGVVTIEFPDGARFVLNRQSAANQMWYAAGARAWHYNWGVAEKAWVCDRDSHELNAMIAKTISEKIGRPVEAKS